MNNKQDRHVKIAIISSGIALMLASSIASAQEGNYVGFNTHPQNFPTSIGGG